MRISAKNILLAFFLLQVALVTAQEKFVNLDEGKVKIYVEDYGKGQPIIFIPGWTMTSKFFKKQKEHFKLNYRYIVYDPRSHGKSTKTEGKNTYAQHAQDLKDIIEALGLDNIILVGWSSGCATMFEYLKVFGEDKIDKLVFIDEPPKWIGDSSKEWVYGSFDNYRGSLKDLIIDRKSNSIDIVKWMLEEEVFESEAKWMVEEMMRTPNDAALSLYIDGMASDYTEVLKKIDSETPILYLLRESWYEEGKTWLQTNTANTVVEPISSHAMFWENPGRFNQILEDFFKK